uniref:Uncharacterized protein n=1 Tax=Arundo donax TaxID=35708 RepID=A0A0A9UPI4_ARUDO
MVSRVYLPSLRCTRCAQRCFNVLASDVVATQLVSREDSRAELREGRQLRPVSV